MSVSGANIAPGTAISSLTATTVVINSPVLNLVPIGSSVIFTPPYTADLTSLVQAWLAFPAAITGTPSSQSYQPSDDDTQLWPTFPRPAAQPAAFLNLLLCAITDGFIIPPPVNAALGQKIIEKLLSSATVTALAAVTAQQWTTFFQTNPTWLPPGTGNLAARIAAFIGQVQTFLAVGNGGPSAPFVLATTGVTAVGGKDLQFAPTTAIMPGMSVSGLNIPTGTIVDVAGVTTTSTSTTVTLTQAVTGTGVPVDTPITFRVTASGGAGSPYPTLPFPSKDWLADCLSAYGAYTLGNGFDLTKLRVAALSVFAGDPAAQEWAANALVTLDALYHVINTATLPPSVTPGFTFSIIEALYARGFTSAAQITQL